MNNINAEDFIDKLKKLDGAIPYDGSASSQVVFRLTNGKTLRIFVVDDDVAETKGLCCDQYEGLKILKKDGTPTTDLIEKEKILLKKQILKETIFGNSKGVKYYDW